MSEHPDSTFPRLVGDIGGTNARFAWISAPGGALQSPLTLPCANYPGPAEAIEDYLRRVGAPRPAWVAFGIANPITGDAVRMTNHHWTFSIRGLQAQLGATHLRVLNDFTALALALTELTPAELVQVGSGTAAAGTPIALLGAGTGLGISGLIPSGTDWIPLEGEGGHVTLAPFDAREAELIALVGREFPHVSAERILSGPGLLSLHRAVSALHGKTPDVLSAAEISARGRSDSCVICRETLDTFCAMLGTIASNLVLTLGARGGVYIGGGIVPKFGSYFATSPFRSRFEQKGRFSDYLTGVPSYVIHADYPAIQGAARALVRDEALGVPDKPD